MSARPAILIVEDSPALSYTYTEYLRSGDWDVRVVDTGTKAWEIISSAPPAVLLLDLGLPDMNGMDILKQIAEQGIPTTTIVVTAQGSIQVAIAAMRLGAYDFLVKPFAGDRLLVTVRNALERGRLEEIVTTYREQIDRRGFQGIIGSSLAMQAVYRIIESAAPSRASVFITGESGTGKELCAEAIHCQSPRAKRPFVALNCAAIPKDLIESEIFGHVKGAFTGATSDRDGAAAQARGGTLFLDEICEMDISLQSKLLRFIQTGTFQKVGANKPEEADVRFLCATNRDPLEEVRAGRFREDLYYRLHVIPMTMPPLRDREGDVLELAEFFLKRFAKEEGKGFKSLSSAVRQALIAYSWPGNVRQLENVIRNSVVLHDGAEILPEMLPLLVNAGAPQAKASPLPPAPSSIPPTADVEAVAVAVAAPARDVLRPLWRQEKEIIEAAIAECGGNIPKAAAYLEVSPSTIYRKKQSWEAGETG
ncbi:sigma-54 dependent transcriptional regulator [Magnetospirillum sp. SS-4]|uniref:sigma-54-dependent transcriptional regulator n=1 Tax=Magnetospirillum sp. SS-4 TaxID=2681465 RepID=UPI00137E8E5A|nr:sigma-54 dependent transcriptional regulator [Magnetospirillum sp. SS-4]CAA7621963.1 Regulatory protein LuxO [Magnetospirillum sp. SS-4]